MSEFQVRRTRGDKVIHFIQHYCRHTIGEMSGLPLLLEEWQKEFVRDFYTEYWDEQRERWSYLYQSSLLGVPRGAGKSTMCAAIAISEVAPMPWATDAPRILLSAVSRENAMQVYGPAADMVRLSEGENDLNNLMMANKNVIWCDENRGEIRRVSADGKGAFGHIPSLVVRDELHAWVAEKHIQLSEALQTALAKRWNSRSLSVTTSGHDKQTILGRLYDEAMKSEHREDPRPGCVIVRDPDRRFLMHWFAATEDMDPKSPETWRAAHPASWIDEDAIRAQLNDPSIGLDEFRRQWCVAPGTKVLLKSGAPIRADELEVGDDLVVWDEEELHLTRGAVRAVEKMDESETLSITTHRGRSVVVTSEHPFWVRRGKQEGWVMSADLVIGDRLRVALGVDPVVHHAMPLDEAWLLGFLVGDGHLGHTVVTFTSDQDSVIGNVKRIVQKYSCRVQPIDEIRYRIIQADGRRHGANGVLELCKAVGLSGLGSHDKFIPDEVFTGGWDAWRGFLSGYLDADGSVCGNATGALRFYSCNRVLLEQAQQLLANIGVQSSISTRHIPSGFDPSIMRDSHLLNVSDSVSFRVCQQEFELAHQKKAERLAIRASAEEKRSRTWSTRDLDRVVGLEPGSSETIAIEVEHASHVTSGLISHNTNVWTKAKSAWFDVGIWQRNGPPSQPALEIPKDARIYCAVDGAWSDDCTALVWAWQQEEDAPVVVRAHVWGTREDLDGQYHTFVPGGTMDMELVRDKIRGLARLYQVREIAYDPKFFTDTAKRLGDDGFTMVEFPRSGAVFDIAVTNFHRAVNASSLRHDGDLVLASHIESTAAVQTEGAWKLFKLRQSRKIDACIASIMATERCRLSTSDENTKYAFVSKTRRQA
jgi:phage terminase large subunit-like protein